MRTVIIKNITSEGPGTIAEYLQAAGMPYLVLEPKEVPSFDDLGSYGALVVLGGPMAVYDRQGHAQVEKSLELIRDALKRKLKVFGVCLGAQLIADALGARVYRGEGQEIGWMDIELTDSGGTDPVLGALAEPGNPEERKVKVFQWHGDTFDLPEGAELLASSEAFPNQAFRMGQNVYAFQFHIEVTRDIVAGWAANEPGLDSNKIEDRQYDAYLGRAQEVYKQFFARS